MAEKRIAMLTGSFDPVTVGHVDLIERAAKMFDFVYVAIMSNGEKNSHSGGMFSYDERLIILETAIQSLSFHGIKNVKAEICEGLASDYAAARGISYIVRGARCASDFDYEYSLASIMKRFSPDLETVILPAKPEIACVSSTYVRELLKYSCSLDGAMPDFAGSVAVDIFQRHRKK